MGEWSKMDLFFHGRFNECTEAKKLARGGRRWCKTGRKETGVSSKKTFRPKGAENRETARKGELGLESCKLDPPSSGHPPCRNKGPPMSAVGHCLVPWMPPRKIVSAFQGLDHAAKSGLLTLAMGHSWRKGFWIERLSVGFPHIPYIQLRRILRALTFFPRSRRQFTLSRPTKMCMDF